MAFNFDVDTQDILERRKPLTGADLGMTGGMVVQPGERVRPLNMQDVLNIRDQMQPQEIQLATRCRCQPLSMISLSIILQGLRTRQRWKQRR